MIIDLNYKYHLTLGQDFREVKKCNPILFLIFIRLFNNQLIIDIISKIRPIIQPC
jgi:hypothetical protein